MRSRSSSSSSFQATGLRYSKHEQVVESICDSRDCTEYSWVGITPVSPAQKPLTAAACHHFPARCKSSRNQLYVEPSSACALFVLPSGMTCTGMILTIKDPDHERADKFVRHRAKYGTVAKTGQTKGVFFDNKTSLRFRTNGWPPVDLIDDTHAWVEQGSVPCVFFIPSKPSSWTVLMRQKSNPNEQGRSSVVEDYQVTASVSDNTRALIRSALPGEEYSFEVTLTWDGNCKAPKRHDASTSSSAIQHTIQVVKKGDVVLRYGEESGGFYNIVQPELDGYKTISPYEPGRGYTRTCQVHLTCYHKA